MQTITQFRDHLRALRRTGAKRDLNPPRAPLVGDWPSLMKKREREHRIFGCLQALVGEGGFEAGYDSELDARLKEEGFTQPERGTIRQRVENGYLRDLGRPDETGRLTPPHAYLQATLVSMDEPVTEAGLNLCLRGLAAVSGHISREFAPTYAEARAYPQKAWANLSAMRAKGEIPGDTSGWAKSDFDGADSFKFEAPAPLQQRMGTVEDPDVLQAEAAHPPAPEKILHPVSNAKPPLRRSPHRVQPRRALPRLRRPQDRVARRQ